MASEERKYWVKGSWKFNLEAMHDKLYCIIIDSREGEVQYPITIAGTVCKDECDVYDLIEEASNLEWISKSRKVTSREYGRIKQIALHHYRTGCAR